jgi:RNAse (barnase) inhibitor barstar
MRTVRIQASAIADEIALHREFASVMGFPGFYGANWNAWIDCMSYLTSPDAGMTAFHLASDEELRVDVVGGNSLQVRCPEVLEALAECAETVNGRFRSHGERARITINLVEGAG